MMQKLNIYSFNCVIKHNLIFIHSFANFSGVWISFENNRQNGTALLWYVYFYPPCDLQSKQGVES